MGGKGSGRKKIDPNSEAALPALRRELEMVEMAVRGYSHKQIGAHYGVSQQRISAILRKHVAETNERLKDGSEELRVIAFERFERVISRTFPWALPDKPLRVVGEDGRETMVAARPDPQLLSLLLETMQAETKFLGLNAPEKVELNFRSVESFGSEIAALAMRFIPEEKLGDFVKALRDLMERERSSVDAGRSLDVPVLIEGEEVDAVVTGPPAVRSAVRTEAEDDEDDGEEDEEEEEGDEDE